LLEKRAFEKLNRTFETKFSLCMDIETKLDAQALMPIEAVQKALNRSRASVYRYANTDPTSEDLNPPYNPGKLNPELRINKDDPLLFHPNEVARFAQDILGIKQVTIEVQQPAETLTQELLRAILTELRSIHQLLKAPKS
jgi:hypothetical protein